MRLAIFSLTSQGAKLGQKIRGLLADGAFPVVDTYCKQSKGGSEDREFNTLAAAVTDLFAKYDGLVFIMATGIVVRTIAPLLQDKRTDPAIVVMDEKGRHVISLLSGHLGRANHLTNVLAERLAAAPVITTASDVQGKTAPDVVAAELRLAVSSYSRLRQMNNQLVEGQPVQYFLDERLPGAAAYAGWFKQNQVDFQLFSEFPAAAGTNVLITDRLAADSAGLFLRPKTLVAGIGCRRGTAKEQILQALEDACTGVGRSMASVGLIASVSLKADEVGLLAAAAAIDADTVFYEPEILNQVVNEQDLTISDFVKEKIGVGSVCEAAAICGAKNNQLLLKKKTYQGITVALAARSES